jgi:hypothetical protein
MHAWRACKSRSLDTKSTHKILSPSIIINYLVSQHILAVQFLDRSQCEEVATRLKGSGALTTSTVSSH